MKIELISNESHIPFPLLRGEICPARYEQLTNRGVSLLRGPARPSHSGGEICPAIPKSSGEQQTNRGVLTLQKEK